MNAFEIYLAYLSWGTGGKVRPVLIAGIEDKYIFIYKITSVAPERKSEKIAEGYIPILDWENAGLHTQSWIDINTRLAFPMQTAASLRFIGKLSLRDIKSLLAKI